MAMKFGDLQLESAYRDHFRPAALRAGFHLETMNENPAAGSLIQRMRLEIRRARFLVADLTHGNHGAYWEAGFAEGQRKPVIYTCEKNAFDDKQRMPHFDVSQEQHVIWEADKLDEAAKRLTLVIRNSLPDEAILQDEPEASA
jgi:nucleoside 2-deoxyribosyltransferase